MAPGRLLVGNLSSLSRGPSRAERTTGVLVRGEAADARKLGSWGDTQWATHESAATTPTRLVAAAPRPGLRSAPLLRPDAVRPSVSCPRGSGSPGFVALCPLFPRSGRRPLPTTHSVVKPISTSPAGQGYRVWDSYRQKALGL